MMRQEGDAVAIARNVLRGEKVNLARLRELANELKSRKEFGYARRILARARNFPQAKSNFELNLKLAQQEALCTYKDLDLPADDRFDWALGILTQVEDLRHTRNQETLGLVGAIYKRKWEVEAQKQYLERSLAYYKRGYRVGVESDFGYTGINAAFVLDVLASLQPDVEADSGTDYAETQRAEARLIREDIVSRLTSLTLQNKGLETDWWCLVTLAESYFGLQQYTKASACLQQAATLPNISEWEFESTATQLAAIARMHAEQTGSMGELVGSQAWEVLRAFLKDNLVGLRTSFVGKVGLALSGGGFRASLFHIGVLARLAELDMLRHVEVLSCVSGGSIIGAHYYLEVRKLLQTKQDSDITREDYLQIIERIERDFLEGVQSNIRLRVLVNPWPRIRKFFSSGYSQTRYLGELLEARLFSKVHDGEQDKPRYLNDLFIRPKGEVDNFAPKNQNWRRQAKVPILILNATTLNTGHNWQFTASWMGESPGTINNEIDANDVLRRMYYEEAPKRHRRVRLGNAVAASACVPALFEPLVLADLYPKRIVRLVDGGVHDNQGVAGLLEQDCTVLLVSDASGQAASESDPKTTIVGVLSRSNNILMARVRDAEYRELVARRRSSLLRGLMFVHLKKDLNAEQVDWIDCEDPHESRELGPLTSYGIRKDVQASLASIRTDLDSFSEAEAFALATSGYRMTEHELARDEESVPGTRNQLKPWRFLSIEEPMKRVQGFEAQHNHLMRLLTVAGERALKPWKLSWWTFLFVNLGVLLSFFLAEKGLFRSVEMLNLSRGFGIAVLSVSTILILWLGFKAYLVFYNRMYLAQGRISSVIPTVSETRTEASTTGRPLKAS